MPTCPSLNFQSSILGLPNELWSIGGEIRRPEAKTDGIGLSTVATVEAYNYATKTWRFVQHLPIARYMETAAFDVYPNGAWL